ncbi:MAG: T9SS type A sorting domain-containing protein [Flavobacteriales bacterium]|nr:T9SS type A sorting domain-containing protein [Flavobacteriales bacterium]
MNQIITLLALAAALAPSQLSAQLSFGGHPYGDKAEKRGMPVAVAVHLPAVDVAALLDEDAARAAQGIKGPFRFGFEHHTDFTLQNSGSWFTMPNGDRVWRLMLHCPEALAINLQFSEYVIPEGARLFLYNEAGTVRGAFTAQSNPGHTAFGTAPLEGDRITVEYIEPPARAGQGRLTISTVVHGYRLLGKGSDRGFGDSGPCNVNTICPEGDQWRPEIRSVAHLVLGGGVCTGTLLNNCANDSTPYFLTANHCTEGNNSNASWVFIFNWESPTCDPTENAPMDHSITGCDKLLENPPTDASFLLLSSTPPPDFQPYFAGWDITGTAPDSVVGIHHPRGDIKKITSSHGPIIEGQMSGADCWQVTEWHSGTTEPGSSGSGLWNQDHRLIGQLFGGQASCGNNVNDFYGRFNLTYPLLEEWLGACGDTLDGFEPGVVIPGTLDGAVTSIAQVPNVVCNSDSITPVITLKNNGEEAIQFANINYAVDGAPLGSMPWYGSIQPLQTVNVTLPTLHLPSGVHWLHVSVSDPNLAGDANPLNDTDSLQFMISSPGLTAVVQFDLDRFGTETTWRIETPEGFAVATGGPYLNSPNGYAVTEEVCLAHDCYLLTVQDAVGDGICCNYGEGDFRVVDILGDTLLNGYGDFGASYSGEFCMNWTGVPEAAATALQVAPNPSDGRFTLYLPGPAGRTDLRVQDALGRLVWTGRTIPGADRMLIDLGHLANGTYLLVAEGKEARAVQRLVVRH